MKKSFTMTITTPFLVLLLLLFLHTPTTTPEPDQNPYFSKPTLFSDHTKMLTTLKIFIYPPPENYTLTLPQPLHLLYTTLVTSHFVTRDPSEAALFLLPFTPQPARSLVRYIDTIRTTYPYWDLSLGADHFYLTCAEMGPPPSRNVVELRKNAVQVSCFPSPAREFVPHKDVTLPPYNVQDRVLPRGEGDLVTSTRYLGYLSYDQAKWNVDLIEGLRNDVDFLVESEPLDEALILENMENSKFCFFVYDVEGMKRLSTALAQGCVPVVISDHPIQDFPLMDVIRWSEIVLFVGSNMGRGEIKSVLNRACEGGYEKRRRMGMAAAHHITWNSETKPLDAFEMVVYQLWLRRHAIKYERWGGGIEST